MVSSVWATRALLLWLVCNYREGVAGGAVPQHSWLEVLFAGVLVGRATPAVADSEAPPRRLEACHCVRLAFFPSGGTGVDFEGCWSWLGLPSKCGRAGAVLQALLPRQAGLVEQVYRAVLRLGL